MGLCATALLTATARAAQRITLAPLGGGFIFQLWLLSRFILAPALTLLIVALIGVLPFSSAATYIVLAALLLLGFYGGILTFTTGILADVVAMIKSRHRAPPSDG